MVFPFARYKIEGRSMEPTLKEGEEVVVFRWMKGKVGDLVIFKKNAKTMIKRIHSIEQQRVYVKGDHAAFSTDSDSFGAVERSKILGKVLFKICKSSRG